MKLSLALLVLLMVLTFAVMAAASVTTHEYVAPPGWSLMALRGVPLDPEPSSVFGSAQIDGRLYRWNAARQSMLLYDELDPDFFGDMLLTEGYWLKNTTGSNETVSFSGLNDNDAMDVWISLPKKGWTLIGHPFSYSFPWQNAKVTDGNTTKSLFDASQWGVGWVCSVGYGWDQTHRSMFSIGVEDDFPMRDTLEAWHGYWIKSFFDKKALILESIP